MISIGCIAFAGVAFVAGIFVTAGLILWLGSLADDRNHP